MDLIVFSIALYKKSWYEMHWNATLPMAHSEYRAQIEQYAAIETKASWTWNDLVQRWNHLPLHTRQLIEQYEDGIKSAFHTTETFPDLFRKISSWIPMEKQFCFFQYWLEELVTSFVTLHRTWHILHV